MYPNRVYLTGYRGTGKTTVGQMIASRLSTQCIDLDEVIEKAAKRTIREIFATDGEAAFRDWETRCLQGLDTDDGRVISLGGGAILREINRQCIRQTGVCIWLTASASTIADRITADQTTSDRRPALTELSVTDEIASVLAEREPLYRDASDWAIATDGHAPMEIADAIVRWLEQRS